MLRCVSIGDLVWQMGYDHLIAAYARLHRAGVVFRARIIGEGELRPMLKFSIADMGLNDVLTILPSDPAHPLAGLDDADLLVISSHLDSARPPLRAALERRLPLVTTAFAGLPDLPPGVPVTVTPLRDARALSEAIARAGHEVRA
jgi:glycosyltransferase involved in cell wall biosynthesis